MKYRNSQKTKFFGLLFEKLKDTWLKLNRNQKKNNFNYEIDLKNSV